jgi:enterochelin esterase-like enzyme
MAAIGKSAVIAGVGMLLVCHAHAQNEYAYREADSSASPRIAKLRKEVESGNQSALAQFWTEMRTNGTPLVEQLPRDEKHALVTFIWEGSPETKNVAIINGINGAEPAKNQMSHLRATDVWYRTYDIRSDARFTYAFSPNDSLQSLLDSTRPPTVFERDPLNPRTFPGIYPSYVELPGAPKELWLVKDAAKPMGKVEAQKFQSDILGGERQLWVYTPPGFTANGGRYPLLVMFDGGAYVTLVPTQVILDNLINDKRIPPMVAVFVGSADRGSELTCSPKFASYIATEVIPWIRKTFNTTNDPASTIVAGSSLGGLAASYLGFTHPESVGNVLSLSGSYWWSPKDDGESEWLLRQFARAPRSDLRFFVSVGTMEERASQLVANRHLRDVLIARGYSIEYQEFNGVHDYLDWRDSFVQGMLELIGQEAAK